MYTIEETRTSPSGFLFTRGPGAYKIPAFGNCPGVFTVHILQGQRNLAPRAVYSSKAIGEPPLLLSLSTFCAIREAIAAARKEEGLEEFFRLDAPASCERIRMACVDSISSRVSCSSREADFINFEQNESIILIRSTLSIFQNRPDIVLFIEVSYEHITLISITM